MLAVHGRFNKKSKILKSREILNFLCYRWFEFHKKLMLLNQQSIHEISTLREETVKEWFVNLCKVSFVSTLKLTP